MIQIVMKTIPSTCSVGTFNLSTPSVVNAQKPRFKLGHIVMTTHASDELPVEDICAAIDLHADCDWGLLSPPDWDAMDDAVKNGGPIWSAHSDRSGLTFWIITEADRSATTVLLPAEY
jgi:hypothetical protein